MMADMDSIDNWGLMAKYILGECTVEEKEKFESWLNSSAENKAIYEKTLITWQKTDSFDQHPNPEAVWDRIDKNLKKPTKVVRINPLNRVVKFAAIVVIMIGVGYLVFNGGIGLKQDDSSYIVINNDSDLAKEIVLNDGTHLWINAGSIIKHPGKFKSNLRNVILEGEAFFDVARDESRPFIIEAGESKVKVLGTSFNVNARKPSKAVIVNVNSGKVALSDKNSDKELILKRGDQGVLNVKSGSLKKIKNYDANIWSWKTGIITFDNASLDYVVPVLEKHYGIKIRVDISQEERKEMVLISTFNKQSFSNVAEVLEYTLGISITKKDDLIIFAK